MKLYKKIQAAFGGAGLYLDKAMLRTINATVGDEVIISLEDDKLVISKAKISNTKIEELLNVNGNSKKRV